ncbi:NEW3 domain-containing protein [Chloroflexota bacterium]
MIKKMSIFCCLCLLLASLLAVCIPGSALAQEGEEPEPVLISEEEEEVVIPDKIALNPDFPTVEAIAGGQFEFRITILYYGAQPNLYLDLNASGPPGWEVYMTPRYEKERKISSINLKPSFSAGEEIILVAQAPFWPLPDPGEYKITLEGVAETVSESIELTTVITAKYIMDTVPANERYNTVAEAGKDNIYSIKVRNLGTDAIDNIKLSPDSPDGWSVTFTPDKVDVLDAFDEQVIEINIKPPPKTVAGDYIISLQASGTQTVAGEMAVRVSVETPTIWGWVGVVIILIVVVGLIIIFMRFSRR